MCEYEELGRTAPEEAQTELPASNPVSRARILVEMEVPESQRGPGWDRHWRELEAYAEAKGHWSGKSE